jgi:hypothetical protein
MRAGEFIRRVERIGRRRGVAVRFETGRGKGSHGPSISAIASPS